MGTDNSVGQQAKEEEIDEYQGFALGDFFPQWFFAIFLSFAFRMSDMRISQSVLSNNDLYKKPDQKGN